VVAAMRQVSTSLARRAAGAFRRRGVAVATVVVCAAGLAACSGAGSSVARGTSAAAAVSSRGVPSGRAALLSGPITQGTIIEPTSPVPVDLAAAGYVEQEYFASGTATAYQPVGPLSPDGRWAVRPQSTAAYRTRIVVRRPADPRRFNGTVLVEWLNVSGGVEADPDWAYLNPEIVRDGYAYVAVSVQRFGVDGGRALLSTPGAPPSTGLVGAEPARYGTLVHPGDQYAFDIFSQIGMALRDARRPAVFGDLHPRRFVAVGESQSAFFLTTYIDAIQPRTHVYDGFFVHSRAGTSASLSGGVGGGGVPGNLWIRTDVDVPVFIFETETDLGPLLDYGPARQPDSARIHTWEVAGTAHADAYLVGPVASLLGCHFTVNEGPQHVVAQAALAAFERWLTTGTPPPVAARLQLASTSPPVIARDALGNALGGVRTPAVDVPVATLSGNAPPGASLVCSLFGSTVPFDGATLVRLYHDKAGYLAAYTADLDRTIAAGFLLAADRAELLAQAQAVQFPS